MSAKRWGTAVILIAILALTVVGVLVMGGQEPAKADPPVITGYASQCLDPCDDWVMFDDFRVRKYVDPEPYFATGWEDEQNGPYTLDGYSWDHRRQFTIIGDSDWSSDQTDYQVKLTVSIGTGTTSGDELYIDTGKLQSDYDDIRFTNDDSTPTVLSYWRDPKTGGDSAVFWIELDAVPKASSADFYIYYDSPTAPSASLTTDSCPSR